MYNIFPVRQINNPSKHILSFEFNFIEKDQRTYLGKRQKNF